MLGRLLVGQYLNGSFDPQAFPESFRPVAERLNGAEPDDRQDIWSEFLSFRPDSDEIIEAVSEADVEGVLPDAEDHDDWPDLRIGGLPPVEDFPLEVLPLPARRLVEEGAEAIGCPHDYLAVPAIVTAAGAIGRSVSLLLKRDYFASGSIFSATVGHPSDGKSPAIKTVSRGIRRIDKELAEEYHEAIRAWEDEVAANPKAKSKPPRPRPRRIDIDDATMEVLPLILADNPRGLVMIRDELTALMMGMNQYKGGKGNDRSTLLKIWSGDAIKKDRVNHEDHAPIRCNHPCLSIVGGMTPGMLEEMVDPKGRIDGFTERFLIAYPDSRSVPEWSERGIPDETLEDWTKLVERLWIRPLSHHEGQSVPHVMRFTPEGKACWTCFYNRHSEEMNDESFPVHLRGTWGKMREYAGRLALVLALMHHAADPTSNPLDVPNAGPDAVEKAWTLIDYFKSHARRVHAAIQGGPGLGGGHVTQAIVEWIQGGGLTSFSERDIKQARRWITPEELSEAIEFLVQRNAIRLQPTLESESRKGRPKTPTYDVNPRLLNTQNTQNTQNED